MAIFREGHKKGVICREGHKKGVECREGHKIFGGAPPAEPRYLLCSDGTQDLIELMNLPLPVDCETIAVETAAVYPRVNIVEHPTNFPSWGYGTGLFFVMPKWGNLLHTCCAVFGASRDGYTLQATFGTQEYASGAGIIDDDYIYQTKITTSFTDSGAGKNIQSRLMFLNDPEYYSDSELSFFSNTQLSQTSLKAMMFGGIYLGEGLVDIPRYTVNQKVEYLKISINGVLQYDFRAVPTGSQLYGATSPAPYNTFYDVVNNTYVPINTSTQNYTIETI